MANGKVNPAVLIVILAVIAVVAYLLLGRRANAASGMPAQAPPVNGGAGSLGPQYTAGFTNKPLRDDQGRKVNGLGELLPLVPLPPALAGVLELEGHRTALPAPAAPVLPTGVVQSIKSASALAIDGWVTKASPTRNAGGLTGMVKGYPPPALPPPPPPPVPSSTGTSGKTTGYRGFIA